VIANLSRRRRWLYRGQRFPFG